MVGKDAEAAVLLAESKVARLPPSVIIITGVSRSPHHLSKGAVTSTLTNRLTRLEKQAQPSPPDVVWAKLTVDSRDDSAEISARLQALHAQGFNVILRTIIDSAKQP